MQLPLLRTYNSDARHDGGLPTVRTNSGYEPGSTSRHARAVSSSFVERNGRQIDPYLATLGAFDPLTSGFDVSLTMPRVDRAGSQPFDLTAVSLRILLTDE